MKSNDKMLNDFFKAINKFYKETPAMHENDYDWNGFRWISLDDRANSIIAFRRIALNGDEVICVCNFQPVPRENYRIGVPAMGIYKEVFNSDSTEFGGSGVCNIGDIPSENIEKDYLDYSIEITVPPLGVSFYRLVQDKTSDNK